MLQCSMRALQGSHRAQLGISSVDLDGERPAAGRAAQDDDGVAFEASDRRFAGRQRTDGPAQPSFECSDLLDRSWSRPGTALRRERCDSMNGERA